MNNFTRLNMIIKNGKVRLFLLFFFFSSRRRHTRWNCDWSSDVCSSDLGLGEQLLGVRGVGVLQGVEQADGVPGAVADRPQLVERDDRGRGDLDQRLLEQIGRASCRERV